VRKLKTGALLKENAPLAASFFSLSSDFKRIAVGRMSVKIMGQSQVLTAQVSVRKWECMSILGQHFLTNGPRFRRKLSRADCSRLDRLRMMKVQHDEAPRHRDSNTPLDEAP